jgi:hypothetical protein
LTNRANSLIYIGISEERESKQHFFHFTERSETITNLPKMGFVIQ